MPLFAESAARQPPLWRRSRRLRTFLQRQNRPVRRRLPGQKRRPRRNSPLMPPAASVNSAPPAGKTKGIVIAAVVVALAVICIAALALLGGGAKAEPVIGHWEMYAVYDSDTESTQIAPRNAGYFVEFRKDGSATLQIGDDLAYECSWSFNQSKSDEEDRYYNMQCDDIPGFTAMLTDLSGVDSVMIVIPGLPYGMVFQQT